MKKVSVLMVCTANICRSPAAQGILKQLLESELLDGVVEVDSAGTHVFQAGHRPDPRSQKTALQSGIDLSGLRARMVRPDDFARYDYILAMDENNLRHLEKNCPGEFRYKLSLILEFAPELGMREVPDPYFGNLSGFERVFEMLETASRGLVQQLHKDTGS